MTNKVLLAAVFGFAGLLLIGISAGLGVWTGVLLCMFSHHLEKHCD
jgi:hypothetical protein